MWSDGDHNGYNAGSEPPAETWSWIREESSYSVTLSTSEGIATSGLHPGSSVGITAQVTRETWQLWQSNLGRSEARDRSLAPGYGASVDFSIGSGSGALSYGSMSANYAGTASTTLTVGTTDCQVIASVGFGGTRPSASLNLSVNQEWIYSGDGSKRIVTMAPDQDAPRTVVASVTLQTWKNGTRLGLSEMHDFAEVPALGAAVSFTCLQGGAWLQPQAGVTDRYGRVRCTYGSYHQSVIRADADFSGVTGSATITVPATDAPPDDPPEETWTDSHVDVSLSVTAASTGLSNDRKSMGLSASASCSRTLIQISNWGNTRSIPLPSDGRLSVAWSIASGDATISASATGSSATAQLGTQASVAEVSVSCDGQSGSATVELPPRPDEEEDEEEEEENPGGNSPPIYRLSLSPGGVRVFKPGDVLPTQATVSASTTDSSATRVALRIASGVGQLSANNLDLTSASPPPTVQGLLPGQRTVVEGQFYASGSPIGSPITAEVMRLLAEVKVVNRDDPKRTWTSGPVVAGPLAYTSPTITEVPDVKNGDLISWKVPGLLTGSYEWWATGPQGVRKDAPPSMNGNEWKLEDPLDWLPGTWTIHCRYTPTNSQPIEFNFAQNLGYRSTHITVIGWINGDEIILPDGTLPVHMTTRNIFGQVQQVQSVEPIATIMGSFVTRLPFLGSIANHGVVMGAIGGYPRYKVAPLTPDPARRYVNSHLIKFSPNTEPPSDFTEFWPGSTGLKIVDLEALRDFKSRTNRFRAFHQFQVRFQLDETGRIKGEPTCLIPLDDATAVGVTPTELGDLPAELGPLNGTVLKDGSVHQSNPKNGRTLTAALPERIAQVNQGRISTNGANSGGQISEQLNNLIVPWIWSIIPFGSAAASSGAIEAPQHEIFPSYHVLYNGRRIEALTHRISAEKLEEFIQLGEAP